MARSDGLGTGRSRYDWDAIERDFRTGKFTLKELSTKHGPGYADISRRATKFGWSKDLREAVRQATSAALIAETTKAATNEAQIQTTNVVVAAAELNKQVILGHRTELRKAREAASSLMVELEESAMSDKDKQLLAAILAGDGAEPKDEADARRVVNKALGMSTRVSCIKALAETFVKLHTGERTAFGLDETGGGDDQGDQKPASTPTNALAREIAYALHLGMKNQPRQADS